MNVNQLPAIIKREIPTAQLPANYVAARRALAEVVRVDECADWANKAKALASYARQAKRPELNEHARRIMLRAVLRMGELLKEIAPTLGRPKAHTSGLGRSAAMRAAGITASAGGLALRLASAPRERIRALENSPPNTINTHWARKELPRTSHLGRIAFSDAVRAVLGGSRNSNTHGLRAFVTHVIRKQPATIARQFTQDEAAKVRPLIQEAADWLDEFERNLPKPAKAKGAK